MDGARSFDPYELVGVATPGVVVSLLLATEAPQFNALLGQSGVSVGGFGVFLVVSFVLGHLVQSLGNLLEAIVWSLGGLPTDWIRNPQQTLVTAAQRSAFMAGVQSMEATDADPATYNRHEWFAVISQASARVRRNGHCGKIDASNRAYGLSRGLAAAFAVSLGWYIWAHPENTGAIAVLGALLVAAVLRMRRSGISYARALIVEFVELGSS